MAGDYGLLGDPNIITALGLLGARRGEMPEILMRGFAAAEGQKRTKAEEQLRALQMQQMRAAMEERQQAQARQQQEQQLAQQYLGGGLAHDQAGPPQTPDPMGFARGLAGIDPIRGFQMMQQLAPSKPESFTLKPGERRYQGEKVVAEGSPDMNQMIVMGPDGRPMLNPLYVQGKKEIAAAGKPSITTSIIPPQKTFEESLKLKKDFDDQPEVKGFKEVRQAWDQIDTALKRPSPANDLAAATKFMKLLDPGSVVRESELMMAMQASGKLDYFLNTANRIISGEKLTPKQRLDFHMAGKALHDAAEARYKSTQGQYQDIAKKYGLDVNFMGQSNGWKILD